MSSVSLILDEDGVARHISHLRRVPGAQVEESESDAENEDDGVLVSHSESNGIGDDVFENSRSRDCVSLRRSVRERNAPRWLRDYDVS